MLVLFHSSIIVLPREVGFLNSVDSRTSEFETT